MARIYSQQEIQAFNDAERELASFGLIVEDKFNTEVLIGWFDQHREIPVTKQAVINFVNHPQVKDKLHWKSQAQQKCEQAAQDYTTDQQNILADFLKSRHLTQPPADEGFENATALLGAMRGRSFDYHNLDFCLQYLQSKGQKLFWAERPSQGRENRGHAHVPGERWMPKEEVNRPFYPSHSGNRYLNGQAEREAREAEKRRFNPDAKIEADIAWAKKYWSDQVAKAISEGRTHTERARIAQAAQQTPGGPRLQAAAAEKEAALIRRERERGR